MFMAYVNNKQWLLVGTSKKNYECSFIMMVKETAWHCQYNAWKIQKSGFL